MGGAGFEGGRKIFWKRWENAVRLGSRLFAGFAEVWGELIFGVGSEYFDGG